MTHGRNLERELKLDLAIDDAGAHLSDLPRGAHARPLPGEEFTTRYFDSSDRRLLERNLSFRHRAPACPAHEGIWTLKLPAGASKAATVDRTEVTWPGSPHEMPEGALQVLRGVLRFAPLGPLVQMTTSRRRWLLVDRSGEVAGEVDDDTVTVCTGGRQGERFRQVEIELGAGDGKVVKAVHERLIRHGAMDGAGSKLRVALSADRPPRARPPGPDASLLDALSASIMSSFGRLVDHDVLLRLDIEDVEAVHQARVATRRLRSDLKTVGRLLDPVWVSHVRQDLAWVGAALGAVRDVDVLTEQLTPLLSDLRPPDDHGVEEISQRLRVRAVAARLALREVMDSRRYLLLLDRLHAAGARPPFRAMSALGIPASEGWPLLVRKPWRRLRQALDDAGRQPSDPHPGDLHQSDEELHAIRIKAKRLRYAAESAAPVVGERARATAEAAKALQEVLGDHHDAVTAEQWLRSVASTASPSVAFVAGQLVQVQRRRQADLRRTWRRAARPLEQPRPRWLKV